MAQALGLLGGAVAHSSVTNIGSNVGGTVGGKVDEITVGNGGGGDRWIAPLPRDKRMREAACFRLKEAASRVISVIGSIVEGLQKQKTYETAVMLLRLMVRSDQVKGTAQPRTFVLLVPLTLCYIAILSVLC